MPLQFKDGTPVKHENGRYSAVIDNELIVLDRSVKQALEDGIFTDAAGAFFFQRELEHIEAQSYDVLYPEKKARQIFNVANEGGKGVNHFTYRTYDRAGSAEIIHGNSYDMKRCDVSGKEITTPVRSVGNMFGYSIDELEASQRTGVGLEAAKAEVCRAEHESTLNDVAFFGDAASGLPGLFSNPNIPTGAVVNPGGGTEWVNKSHDQILFDVNTLCGDMWETTKMIHMPDKLLLPPAQYSYIFNTRLGDREITIAQYLVKNSQYLKSVEDIIPLNECVAANNPELSDDAMVCFESNPRTHKLLVPVELEFMPVQRKGFEFEVPARSRIGGLRIMYPLAFSIKTGI